MNNDFSEANYLSMDQSDLRNEIKQLKLRIARVEAKFPDIVVAEAQKAQRQSGESAPWGFGPDETK